MSTDDPRERLEVEARQLDERQVVLDAEQTRHDAIPRTERDQSAMGDLADETAALAIDRARSAELRRQARKDREEAAGELGSEQVGAVDLPVAD